jgi:hypothetical protein
VEYLWGFTLVLQVLHNGVHNCLNTCLYALWSTLILNLMHSILFFSGSVFDEFIAKWGEIVHKVDWTLANQVVERRNMINDYLRGRACIERARGGGLISGGVLILSFCAVLSFCVDFERFLLLWALLSYFLPFCLALPLFLPVVGFCGFPSSRWPSWAFLGFLGLLVVLHGVLDSNFKLCAFVVNGLIKGGDWETKWSVPWFDCDESLTWWGLNSNLG